LEIFRENSKYRFPNPYLTHTVFSAIFGNTRIKKLFVLARERLLKR
jgi:hypothetical protein